MSTQRRGIPRISFEQFHARNLEDALELRGRWVAIIGVGATGSFVARDLSMAGLNLLLIDRDLVEKANLSRHIVTKDLVGISKAKATAVTLRASLPQGQLVHTLHLDIERLSNRETAVLLSAAHPIEAVVAATGSDDIDRRLDLVCLGLNIPFVVPGIYAAGRDFIGEVRMIPWGRSREFACFSCHRPPERSTARPLEGVPGSIEDVSLIAALTTQVMKGLLLPETGLGRLVESRIGSGRTELRMERGAMAVSARRPLRRPTCSNCSASVANERPLEAHLRRGQAAWRRFSNWVRRNWNAPNHTSARRVGFVLAGLVILAALPFVLYALAVLAVGVAIFFAVGLVFWVLAEIRMGA